MYASDTALNDTAQGQAQDPTTNSNEDEQDDGKPSQSIEREEEPLVCVNFETMEHEQARNTAAAEACSNEGVQFKRLWVQHRRTLGITPTHK